MDKFLRPGRLDTDPSSSTAEKDWLHWIRTFENFVSVLPADSLDKLQVLTNYVSPRIFEYIEHCENYGDAIATLKVLFIKPTNEVFARHLLATRRQRSGETMDEFLQALKTLAKDCKFRDVTAAVYRDEAVRDAFIAGLLSNPIRQRLLENSTLDLDTMFTQARSLDVAQKSSETYVSPNPSAFPTAATTSSAATSLSPPSQVGIHEDECEGTLAATTGAKCYFCGYSKHPRHKCPAKDATCRKCQKRGHFAKVCKSNPPRGQPEGGTTASMHPTLATVPSSTPPTLLKSSTEVTINGTSARALVDSGSSESFIHPRLADSLNLRKYSTRRSISMAQSSLSAETLGHCIVNLEVDGKEYPNLRLSILPGLCSELILGLDFQKQHQSISFHHGGPKPPLVVCGLTTLKVEPPDLFANLTTADVHPIATKSWRYSYEDRKFIDSEVQHLLAEGIIEPSNSPWRAQVVVTHSENHKKRLAIDYSQTINRFTLLDAYPLPRIDDTVNAIAQYRVFSTIDLRSAYHQVSIRECDKPYTAFQAGSALYQFTRIPFGVTNGVACFQRIMTDIIASENLQGTIPYIDDVTICGKDQEEHNENLKRFQEVAARRQITCNDDKSVFSTRKLSILGHIVEEGEVRPDPERLRPLLQLPTPTDKKSLNRVLGFFSHYSPWIQHYSEKIRPLTTTSTFPISREAKMTFESLKKDIANSVVCAVNEDIPFSVETDASDYAIAATLNQNGRPVAFFSRTLHGPEISHASVEKEAKAIIEAIRHWRHYLTGRHFTITTDQRSVAYMFDNKQRGKIKK